MEKKKRKRIVVIVLLALVAVAAWYFFFRKKETPVKFTTESPAYGPIATTVTATGTIKPVDTVAVGTQVSGTLAKLYVDFNSQVKKGQLLAELDKSLFQASVDQYRGNLANARSQLVLQEATFHRQQLLFNTGAISKQEYDNATYQLSAAKASVSSVEAQLRAAEKNLYFTEIYSPIDGVVLNRNVSVGQTVAASFSTPTLFVIARDITKMQVQAGVDEADIGAVKDSQRATFTVDAYLEDVFSGKVHEIRLQPTTSANVVTYNTIINAPNDDMKLMPGMTANVTIYTAERDHALLIPVRALKFVPDSAAIGKKYSIQRAVKRSPQQHLPDTTVKREGDVNYVWLLRGDTLQQRRIRMGLTNNTEIEVLQGLSPSDIIITGMEGGNSQAAAAGAGGSPFMPQMRRRR